ncbi:bacteriohemerythrin [Geomesophilobacter sediminis]|uniref:Hemerythrin family protein n=1 Tax=Geomesophilobacter sediminis TaxID=2798584 RepID=A0A8J7LZA3_9BACT|nr:bacteriohemerythrin [Geomesophilobacter sediminis]MBJ6726472.1 hemerythrin family protein [Geomesophilobacter sediminis]
MSMIEWSDELSIGIDYIDEQHKQLMAIINELQLAVEYDKGPDFVYPIIEHLYNYANTHFSDEEELLRMHNYPDLIDHRQEHLAFISKIDELKNRYETDREGLTIHLRNFLLGWLYNHIKSEDQAYRHFLDRKGVLPHSHKESGQDS